MREARLEDYVDGEDDLEIQEMLQALKTRNSLYVQGLKALYEAHGPQPALDNVVEELFSGATVCGQEIDHLQAHTKLNPKPKSTKREHNFTVPQPFHMTVREAGKRQTTSLACTDPGDAWNEDEAECLKQFRARSVPAHVFLPLYNELMEQNEEKRKSGIQRRTEMLLSMQKPFRLTAEDRRKPQAGRQETGPTHKTPSFRKPIPKSVLDPTVSDQLREAELFRKIQSQMRAKDLLERSSAPIPISHDSRDPGSRSSLKSKQRCVGFLQQKPSFQPRTNASVPDFQELYRNFQKLSLKKQSVKEPTESKPFNLRTSSLRRSRRGSQTDAVEDTPQDWRPVRSSTHLSSLSPNTLPVYITDATKRREAAIRTSLEDKDHEDAERESWLRKSRQKALRMQHSLSRRAKALDPHRPLAESSREKRREIRQAERRRSQEYKEELKQMKAQVKRRPYLFERVPRGTESPHTASTQQDRLTQGNTDVQVTDSDSL